MEFIVPLVLSIGLITALSLLWLGLISAPWPVLLVILIFGLLVTDKLIRQISGKAPESVSEKEVAKIEKTKEKEPGFVYRGVCYEKNEKTLKQDEEPKKEVLVGKYRGVECSYLKKEEPISTRSNKIKYRGATLG